MNVTGPNVELPRVLIIGGGVHAAVVADCIRATHRAWLAGYSDAPGHDPAHMKRLGVPHLGSDDVVRESVGALNLNAAILGVAGLEHEPLRRVLSIRFCERISRWWTAIHPAATVAESARIGEGTAVLARAVINPLARIGRHAVINTGAVVEHHCLVEDFAVVSPHATLCGGVRVGEGAFIGAGATIITGVTVGASAIVGAGAVVLHDVAACDTVVGNPARILRSREANCV